ncbi:hypothetical protein D3C86_436750 [compost metagenome]
MLRGDHRPDLGLRERAAAAAQQLLAAGVGNRELPAKMRACRVERRNLEGQLNLRLPGVGRQQFSRDAQKIKGRLIGRRLLGLARRIQVEPREVEAFRRFREVRPADVQVPHDLGRPGESLLRAAMRLERASDVKVRARALGFRDQGVGRLAHPVMQEVARQLGRGPFEVSAAEHQEALVLGNDHSRRDGRPDRRRHRRGGLSHEDREHAQVEAAAKASREPEQLLGVFGQALQAAEHEGDDVVADGSLNHSLEIPGPVARSGVEGQETVQVQGSQQLPGEEGIAGRLAVDDGAERPRPGGVGLQGVRDEAIERLVVEWFERHANDISGGGDLLERKGERMRGVDLVFAGGPDEQQAQAALGIEKAPQKRQGRDVAPVQVVEEEHDGMLWAREDRDQGPEGREEAVLLFGRVEFGQGRLGPDDARELGHQVGHDSPIGSQCIEEGGFPVRQALLAFGQKLHHQVAQGPGKRGVGAIAAELVELSSQEVAVIVHDAAEHVVNQHRLADARGPRDQHEARLPRRGRLKLPHDPLGIRITAVEAAGNMELGRHVVGCQGKGRDIPGFEPEALAFAQIPEEAPGALIAVLR